MKYPGSATVPTYRQHLKGISPSLALCKRGGKNLQNNLLLTKLMNMYTISKFRGLHEKALTKFF